MLRRAIELLTFYAVTWSLIIAMLVIPLLVMFLLHKLPTIPARVGVTECWLEGMAGTPVREAIPCALASIGQPFESLVAGATMSNRRNITVGNVLSLAGLFACYFVILAVCAIWFTGFIDRFQRWWPGCKPRTIRGQF